MQEQLNRCNVAPKRKQTTEPYTRHLDVGRETRSRQLQWRVACRTTYTMSVVSSNSLDQLVTQPTPHSQVVKRPTRHTVNSSHVTSWLTSWLAAFSFSHRAGRGLPDVEWLVLYVGFLTCSHSLDYQMVTTASSSYITLHKYFRPFTLAPGIMHCMLELS